MPYRPPELFHVNSKCEIDERTDVWVSGGLSFAMDMDDIFLELVRGFTLLGLKRHRWMGFLKSYTQYGL